MRLKKLWFALTLIVLAAIAALSAYLALSDTGGRKRNIDLYFFNAQQDTITSEKREIKYKTADDLPYEVVCALIKGPTDSKLTRIMSSDVTVNSIELIRGDIVVDFSKEYISGESAQDILTTYAVVKSLCSVPNVDRVKVSVCGEAITTPTGNSLSFLSSSDIKLESEMASDEMRKVKLYFANSSGVYLEAEEREVKMTDDQPIEQYIVNELIKGPAYANLSAVLSVDTQVISVQTKDGICFVNLKANFLDRNAGSSAKESFAVYSIVNSLTELSGVEAVQFLIDGKKVNTFGQFGFSEPFERNSEIIMGDSE